MNSQEDAINTLPTFIRTALENYISLRGGIDDVYLRYKALENVYAVTIKYVGTTFALIAADVSSDLRDEAWRQIFSSSSLGGWLDAVDSVCKVQKQLPPNIAQFCLEYSDYSKHAERQNLDRIYDNFLAISKELQVYGYRFDVQKKMNVRRALGLAIGVRNKFAHGSLQPPFFHRIETDLFLALKRTLSVIPFPRFVFWGTYGRNAYEFIERDPKLKRRKHDCYFWVQSDLLKEKFTELIPFLSYREDSKSIYFLNSKPDEKASTAEYVDYESGQVRYIDVDANWMEDYRIASSATRPKGYTHRMNVLTGHQLAWRKLLLTRDGINLATNDESGVYMFVTDVNLGGKPIEVVLYVGKTEDLKGRLESYLRIKGGYDSSRPEISRMFEVYEARLSILFAPLPEASIASVERAIFETTMPEYNLNTPPET